MKIEDQAISERGRYGQNPAPSMANRSGLAGRTSRYRAPALEKGLDVIELLAAEKEQEERARARFPSPPGPGASEDDGEGGKTD